MICHRHRWSSRKLYTREGWGRVTSQPEIRSGQASLEATVCQSFDLRRALEVNSPGADLKISNFRPSATMPPMLGYPNIALASQSDDLKFRAISLFFRRRRALNVISDDFDVVQASAQRWESGKTAWRIVCGCRKMMHKFWNSRIESSALGKCVSFFLANLHSPCSNEQLFSSTCAQSALESIRARYLEF